MRVIHKLGPFSPKQVYELASDVVAIIHFQHTNQGLMLWAEVGLEEDSKFENISILIVGTGWQFEDTWTPYMTTIDPAGYVWHLLLGTDE